MSPSIAKKLDKAGMVLSMTCLVHCLLLPILLATLPFISFLSFMKAPLTETLMIVFAIFNAILAVTLGFKKHKNLIIPAFFISGTILLLFNFIAHRFVESNEYIITIGAFLIGVGHFVNHMFCDHCPTCKEDHE
jgi:hypothetical protein